MKGLRIVPPTELLSLRATLCRRQPEVGKDAGRQLDEKTPILIGASTAFIWRNGFFDHVESAGVCFQAEI